MAHLFVVCDQPDMLAQAQKALTTQGLVCEALTTKEYKDKHSQPSLIPGSSFATPTVGGSSGNVIHFPGTSASMTASMGKVSTIEEMESHAIESAIEQYRGNLTEAAKALGIGRATLYRKVKLYQIDPAAARRKRAA